MTALRVLHAAERNTERWRNGGGVTRPVAVFPPDAGPDDFLWRASIATIDATGPFSFFPGIDRWFGVLDGRLSLAIEGRHHEIGSDDAILAFPGEAVVTAAPLDGSTSDFNLMVRRGAAIATVQHRSGAWDVCSGTALVLALTPMSVDTGHGSIALKEHDALLCEDAVGHRLTLSSRAIVAEITA